MKGALMRWQQRLLGIAVEDDDGRDGKRIK